MISMVAAIANMPINCDHVCASRHKAKDNESPLDKSADYFMTMNQDTLNQDSSSFLQKQKQPLNVQPQELDMGVTAEQCACMGITKITSTTGRELTDDEELNGRLLECDQTEANCKKCCSGDPAQAHAGCKIDQGEEACSQSCEMAHNDCEKAAKNWESR